MTSTPLASNPYTFGSMISDPNRFIGRRSELTSIVARLNGSQPQGVSVVGPRRIGKSSLLHYLHQPRANEQLRPRDNLHIFYLDAQQWECHTPDAFRLALIKLILAQATIDRRTTNGRRLAELETNLWFFGNSGG